MIITSEQVGRGHPDKICDQISDLFVTEVLKHDKDSRIAIESAIKGFSNKEGKLMVFGELSTNMKDVKKIMMPKIKSLLISIDLDYKNFDIDWQISKQSPEINSKVDKENIGAGDQGLMFGYATNETKQNLPIPFVLATKIIKNYEDKIVSGSNDYKYDSKSQVCYDYDKKRLVNINLSVQHSKDKSLEEIKKEMIELVKFSIIEFESENDLKIFDEETEIIVNNAGSFVMGGAIADAGLTGRKIIADTYGGYGRHGGGAFSGKDYTKVDRSAAYYGRYVANKIIENKLASIVEIQVSYIIGQSNPVAIDVEVFETGKKSDVKNFVLKNFDFRLENIIKELDLKNVNYLETSTLGHFGKSNLNWE